MRFAIFLLILFFLSMSIYVWIKHIKNTFSVISIVEFFLSIAIAFIFFLLCHYGLITKNTQVPGFIAKKVNSFFSEESINTSIVYFFTISLLTFLWVNKKFPRFFFKKAKRWRTITYFLVTHRFASSIALFFIYTTLLVISISNMIWYKNSEYIFLLYCWSIIVFFSSAPLYLEYLIKEIN